MQVKKVVQCKIHNLTNIKEQILSDEYNDYQNLCQEVSQCVDNDYIPDKPYFLFKRPDRYSATVWGAIQSITKKPQFANTKEQPLYLRNDVFKITEKQTTISKHWLRLPTKRKHGGIWLPIIVPNRFQELLKFKICDSKIAKRRKGWFLLLTIQKEVQIRTSYSNILAIDLGEKIMATVCGSFNNQRPLFLGREIRGTRRHYAWLRKRLGNKKCLKTIKKIEHTEQRKVNDKLFKISRQINNLAEEHNALIVLGNLKGIRETARGKGKRFTRIVSNMPYLKLTSMITYMAHWDGRQIIKIDERGRTSHTCSRCGSKGIRPHQGLFKCLACGYQANADYNGAKRIAQIGLETIPSLDGVHLTEPITLGAWQHAH
jgi:putative transposase